MTEFDAASPEARIAFVVGRLNRRLGAATGGLSHGLLSALATVANSGPLRIAELGQIERIAAPGITRIVADLESRGMVVRSPDPSDGRAVLIEITTGGTAAILSARTSRAAVIADLLAGLSDSELSAIAGALPTLEKIVGGPAGS